MTVEHPSNEPLRIARIITRLNVGGPAIQAIEMSARLEAQGCHTLLIHGRLGADEADMRYLVPPGHRFEIDEEPALRRELAPAADLTAVFRIVQRLRRFRPAIVHTHMAKAGAVGRTAALIYNATSGRQAPARLVHTYHGHVLDGYFSPWRERLFTMAERTLARRTDALIAVSDIVRRDLLEEHRIGTPNRFRVVPLGFDLTAFSAVGAAERAEARLALGLAPDAHVVSLVGRLTAIKRPDLFVDVATRVAAVDDRARFLIAGGGDLAAALQALSADRQLTDRLRFLGWRRDVSTIYAASDLVAITSRNEGTPVALIEAMATGVPGVCCAVGGVPDVITSPDIGVLVPSGSPADLAAAIQRLFADDRAREAMGVRARASANERFGIDRLTRDLTALYRQVLG